MSNITSSTINLVSFEEDGAKFDVPSWSQFLITLGEVCRVKRLEDNRKIVTLVVLPSRNFAAGLTALGSLLGGASKFVSELTWSAFSVLPIHSEVHFKYKNVNYSGNISELIEINEEEFIKVGITRPIKAARGGGAYFISESVFEDYSFTIEKPPSVSKTASMMRADAYFRQWLKNINPKWIWADGAESLVVGTLSKLTTDYKKLLLKSDGLDPIPMDELLSMQNITEPCHGKVRITHSRGDLSGEFPLVILDGPDAFNILSNTAIKSNILVILERSEYNENISNTVLQLKQTTSDITEQMFYDLSLSAPPGIEFISFVIN